MMVLFNQKADEICSLLDRLTEHYRKRFKIADKRWDVLQDARQAEEDAQGESPLYERLQHLCGRAEGQVEELEWRIEEVGKAYTHLEDIEVSIDKIRLNTNTKART